MSDIYPIAVPKWGIEMVEGTIVDWNKSVGDPITKGDEVFEMESDKIINVWESPVDGVLRRQIADAGEAVPVGGLLGVIAAADIDEAAIDAFIKGFSNTAAKSPSAAAPGAAPAPAPPAAAQRRRCLVHRVALRERRHHCPPSPFPRCRTNLVIVFFGHGIICPLLFKEIKKMFNPGGLRLNVKGTESEQNFSLVLFPYYEYTLRAK